MHGGWHELIHSAAAVALAIGGLAALALAWRGRVRAPEGPAPARHASGGPLPIRPAALVLLVGLLVLTSAVALRAAGGAGSDARPHGHDGHVTSP